jgi:hypothetical protein
MSKHFSNQAHNQTRQQRSSISISYLSLRHLPRA